MTYIPTNDYGTEVALDNITERTVVHKFGRNSAVGTTYVPVVVGGIYRVPQTTGATTLRIKAGDANDSSSGSGARTVTIIGIDENGDEQTEVLTTNGTSAGTAGTVTFIRLYRAYVTTSGTYATQSAGSQAADIIIENSAGTEDWATLDATDFPRGQTEIGVYTIPNGKRGLIDNISVIVDSNKSASVILFQRTSILQTAAPYDAMRVLLEFSGLTGISSVSPKIPIDSLASGTDVGFMARVASGTAEVDVDFEIQLIDA